MYPTVELVQLLENIATGIEGMALPYEHNDEDKFWNFIVDYSAAVIRGDIASN